MTGPVLLVTTATSLLTLAVASDLVLVNQAGQPSDLFRKALSLMEDRDGEAGEVASKETIVADGIRRRAMLAVTRRIKRKPSPVRAVSSESLYNQPPPLPRQRIKFSQRRVFPGFSQARERQRSTTSPRPFSLLRNMQIKRRRRKFQPKPLTEAPFVEEKVSKPCEEEIRRSEDTADNEVQVVGKVRLEPTPTQQPENSTEVAEVEASPTMFVELQADTAASSSERGKKAEGKPLEIFEEHEVKNQIQDQISLMVADETVNGIKGEYDDKILESIINNSKDAENLIIEESELEIDNNNNNDDSSASDFFPEEVTTLEPFVTPDGTENLTN